MMAEKQMAMYYFLPLLDSIQASCCENCADLRVSIIKYIKWHLADSWNIASFPPRVERREYKIRVPRNQAERKRMESQE